MVIDEGYLARQTAGDAALQAELLGLLLRQVEGLQSMLDEDPEASRMSLTDLAAVLHRIRGAAAAVGADGLAHALGKAERDLDRDPNHRAGLDGLRADLDATCAGLAGLIAARGRAGLAKNGESR